MDTWHRRAETGSGIHTPRASFFLLEADDQADAGELRQDNLTEFRSDMEVKYSLPFFGVVEKKCATTNKLPSALSGSHANKTACSFSRRAQPKTTDVDETGGYYLPALNQTNLDGEIYADPTE